MGGKKPKSRKPSATRSKWQPDKITYFVDASLGSKLLPEALRNEGADVAIHNDHFSQGTPDEEWLHVVGERNWVVLTKDNRIRYRKLERDALMRAGVRCFVLTAKGLRGQEIAALFIKALPAIQRFLDKHSDSFIAKITRSSAVHLIVPEKETK